MLKLKLQYSGHLIQRTDIGKDPDAGKDWRQEEKGMAEDEMVGWYHQLDGHEFEQVPGVGDGQGSLLWCRPLGRKMSWIETSPDYQRSECEYITWQHHHLPDQDTFCNNIKLLRLALATFTLTPLSSFQCVSPICLHGSAWWQLLLESLFL